MVGTCWPDVKRFCCDLLSAFLHEPNNPCRLWYMTRGFIKKQQRSSVSHCLGLRHKLVLGPQMYTRVEDNKNTTFALFENLFKGKVSRCLRHKPLPGLSVYRCTHVLIQKSWLQIFFEDDRIFLEAPKSQNDLFSVDYLKLCWLWVVDGSISREWCR